MFSTGRGLGYFRQPAEGRGPWETWLLLSYAGDQGSKEECGKWVCKRLLSLNFDEVPDLGHGIWNDCKLALRRSGHWSHVLLMLLSWNVRHGPWSEDALMQEVLGAVKNFLNYVRKPTDSPLFMSLVGRMAFDQQSEFLGLFQDDLPAALLQRFRDFNPFQLSGSKTNLNRFMSVLKMGRDTAASWTFTYLAMLLACLDAGYLTGSRFLRLLAAGPDMPDRSTAANRACCRVRPRQGLCQPVGGGNHDVCRASESNQAAKH